MKIVVVGPHCWGVGSSLQRAVQKARINYPSYCAQKSGGVMPYNAYEASDDFEVDGFGSISASKLKRIREVRVEGGKKVVRVGNQILGD